ncbi:MAG: hypothetical protein JRJ82_20385 [Deltaproteobacteria bacterium]|nr:hypothetical protein [Deltaproteobacteria bacterium]
MARHPDPPENSPKPSLALRLSLSALLALLIGLAFGFGKIVRDCSLTCNVGYQLSPLAFVAAGLVSIPLTSLTIRMANRLGYKRWQMISLTTIALSFFCFWGATYFVLTVLADTTRAGSSDQMWTFPLGLIYLCFFIWLGGLGAVLKPSIKSTVYRLFQRQEQTKALALTTAAVILGGLLGAWFAGWFAPAVMLRFDLRYELARDSLFLLMGILMLFTIPVIMIISRITHADKTSQAFHSDQEDPDIVTPQVPITAGRTLFFADFYIWLNAWTLLFLVFGTNRLINRFGIIFALAFMPIALFLGSAFLLYQTVIAAIYGLRIIYSSLEQSLYGQGLDRMILEVDEQDVRSVRPVLHGLVIRIGRAVGALLILLLAQGAGISFNHMTVVFMLILVIWLGIALSLHRFLHRSSPMMPPLNSLRSTE